MYMYVCAFTHICVVCVCLYVYIKDTDIKSLYYISSKTFPP